MHICISLFAFINACSFCSMHAWHACMRVWCAEHISIYDRFITVCMYNWMTELLTYLRSGLHTYWRTDWRTGWLTDWLTERLNERASGRVSESKKDWFTSILTGEVTDWLTCWWCRLLDWLIWEAVCLNRCVSDWLKIINQLTDWSTDWLIDRLIDWLTDRLGDWLGDWLIDQLIGWLID